MRARQAGFTLLEVLIALVMLAIVTLALMTMNSRMLRGVTDDRTRTLAAASADARIAEVRSWPTYSTLDAEFGGTESNTPLSGLTRTTTIVRTGGTGQTNDYKRVTVRITGSGLKAAVDRTITIAAP
jgi:type II secretion system protein I